METQQHQEQQPDMVETYTYGALPSVPFRQETMSISLQAAAVESTPVDVSSSATEVVSAAEVSEDISVPAAAARIEEHFALAGAVSVATTCSHVVNGSVDEPAESAASTPVCGSSAFLDDTSISSVINRLASSVSDFGSVRDDCSCGLQTMVRRLGAAGADDCGSSADGKIQGGKCSRSHIGNRESADNCTERGRGTTTSRSSSQRATFRAVAAASSFSLLRDVHAYSISLLSRVVGRKCKTSGALLSLEPCRSAAAALLSAGATCWAQAGEHVLVPAWLALVNHLSLLLYVLLFFERITEIIFHTAACLLPAFVYVLLALLISILSIPPEVSPGTAPAATSVALQQTLPQQQRLVRVILHPSISTGGSAAADLTSLSTVASISPFKMRRYRLLIARRYSVAAASAPFLGPPRYREGRVSPPSVAGVARHPEEPYSSSSHSSKSISNSLPSDSISTRKFTSSIQKRAKARAKKEVWRSAALLGVTRTHAVYAWNLYLKSWLDSSSFPRGANTGKAGDAAGAPMGGLVDTQGTKRQTATGARYTSGSPEQRKHRTAATSAAAPVSAATAAAFGESGVSRKAQQRSRNAGEEEQLSRGWEGVGFALFTSTRKLLSARVDAAKTSRETERKHRMLGKRNSSLTYDGGDVKLYSSTTEAVIAENKTTVTIVGDVVFDVTRNSVTQQREYVGASDPADPAPADLAGEPELREEREEEGKEPEGRAAHMWIVALILAYGYVLLSHVSRGLLLELPIYSVALYLCQLLRLQGLSFSAAPNSTSAATEELAARMHAQFLQSNAIEEVSVRESNAPSTTRDVRNDSNTTTSSSASSSSSTTPISSISIRNNSSSPNEKSDQRSRHPIRRLRSVDSSTPSTSEVVAHRNTFQNVGCNGLAGLYLEEILPPAVDIDSSRFIVADALTPVSADKALDDDRRGHSSQNSLPTEAAAEIVSARKGLATVAEDIQVVGDFEKASFSRNDGYSEEAKFPWDLQKDCKPPSVFFLDRCHSSQRHNEEVAKDSVASATNATTAADGAVVVGAESMNARAEHTQSIRAETRSTAKMSHTLQKSETPAGTRVLDETDGQDKETERFAGDEGGKVLASESSGRSTLVSTTAEVQRLSAILPALEKEVLTMTVQVAVARTTSRPLKDVEVEEAQQNIAGASVPVANASAAEAQNEAAGPALTAEISKHSTAMQVSSKRNDEWLALKMSENDAEAAYASIGEREVATAVKAGRSGLLAQARGPQHTGHVGAVSGSRGFHALSRPLIENEGNNGCVGQRRGYSSGRLVVAWCNIEDSETRERNSNAGVTRRTGIVRVNRRSVSCPSSTKHSSGSSRFSITQVSKNLDFVSSAVNERAAVLPDLVRHATEERSEIGDKAESVGWGADFSEEVRRRVIALLLRSFTCLHLVLWSTLRGLFWRCSYYLTAVVASHYVRTVLLWFASREKLLRALHPYQLLSMSPVRFFPNTSQRLILTTCCFWLLRGLHGDIFNEQGNIISRGTERTLTSFSGGWAGSGAAPSAPSSLLMNTRGNKGSVDTVGMRRLHSNNSSGGDGNTSSGRSSQSRKGESVWRGPVVYPDILPLDPKSDSGRESSSTLLYSPAGRGTFTATTTYRQAILIEPSVFPLEKRTLLISAAHGNHQETRKLGQSAPQRRRQRRNILTWLPYGDGLNSHFLLLYAFLLQLFKWAGEYIQPLRQWTAWLALLLLVLLLVSYSLLSLSSALEILPWQLLHVLLVLRHTSLCTYAACVAKQQKPHLQAKMEKGRQRFSGDVDEKNGTQQPLEAGQQALNVQRDGQCSGDSESKEDDGVDEDKMCIFCFEPFVSTDVLRLVHACGHIFHRRCMDTWLFQKNKETCPFCGPFRSGKTFSSIP